MYKLTMLDKLAQMIGHATARFTHPDHITPDKGRTRYIMINMSGTASGNPDLIHNIASLKEDFDIEIVASASLYPKSVDRELRQMNVRHKVDHIFCAMGPGMTSALLSAEDDKYINSYTSVNPEHWRNIVLNGKLIPPYQIFGIDDDRLNVKALHKAGGYSHHFKLPDDITRKTDKQKTDLLNKANYKAFRATHKWLKL